MTDLTDSTDPPNDRPAYCSRSEAVELAISVMLWSHAIVMVAAVGVEIALFGSTGVWIGLGVVAVLLFVMAPVVLPSAYLIGCLSHRLFHQTTMSVEVAVRLFTILFEANLFGWVLVASIRLSGMW